jgi:hypothetical protein
MELWLKWSLPSKHEALSSNLGSPPTPQKNKVKFKRLERAINMINIVVGTEYYMVFHIFQMFSENLFLVLRIYEWSYLVNTYFWCFCFVVLTYGS